MQLGLSGSPVPVRASSRLEPQCPLGAPSLDAIIQDAEPDTTMGMMAHHLLRAVFWTVDLLLWPLNWIIYRPWRIRQLRQRPHMVCEKDNGPGPGVVDVVLGLPRENCPKAKVGPPVTLKDLVEDLREKTKGQQHGLAELLLVPPEAADQGRHQQALGFRRIETEVTMVERSDPCQRRVHKKVLENRYEWRARWEVHEEADQVSGGLLRGLPGLLKPLDPAAERDNKVVMMFAHSSPEWLVVALACLKARLVLAPLHVGMDHQSIRTCVLHLRPKVIFCSYDTVAEMVDVLATFREIPRDFAIVYFDHQFIKACAPYKGFQSKPQLPVLPLSQLKALPKSPEKQQQLRQDQLLRQDADRLHEGASSASTEGLLDDSEAAVILIKGSFSAEPSSGNAPKGLMVLTRRGLLEGFFATAASLADDHPSSLLKPSEIGPYLAYLPLSHHLELEAELCMFILGVPIGYSSSETMMDSRGGGILSDHRGDAAVLRPSSMILTATSLSEIYKRATRTPSGALNFFIDYHNFWSERGYSTPIADRLAFKDVRKLLGGRLRQVHLRGSDFPEELRRFAKAALGAAKVAHGYGCTECCGQVTVQSWFDLDRRGPGEIGHLVAAVEPNSLQLRVKGWEEAGFSTDDPKGPRGELLLSGPRAITHAYPWHSSTNTSSSSNSVSSSSDGSRVEADDGSLWFKTGLIVEFCKYSGNFRALGKKALILQPSSISVKKPAGPTKNGGNVAVVQDVEPEKASSPPTNPGGNAGEVLSIGHLETVLLLHPAVIHACIFRSATNSLRPALVAMVNTRMEALGGYVAQVKRDNQRAKRDMSKDEVEAAAVAKATSEVQGALSSNVTQLGIPVKVRLTFDDWSGNGCRFLSPTMRPKRKLIHDKYKVTIEKMFQEVLLEAYKIV